MSFWDELSKGNARFTKNDIMQFSQKCKDDKLFFAKHVCKIELAGKQPELIYKMNKYQNVVAVFNRQGGKSTTFAIDDAHDLLYKDYPDGHHEWINVYAPIQNQAEIIFKKVLSFIEDNPITNQYIKLHNQTGYLKLKNGNELMAKSASPNASIRGDSPTKIQVDESQGVCDKQYYEAIIPSGSTTDAKIQEIGTPAGRNHFYRTFHNAETLGVKTQYKTVLQRWHECPIISKVYIEEQMASMPKKSFDQEYLCKWDLDEGFAWDYETVLKSLIMPPENIPPEPKTPYVAGVDVAKSPAETVLWIAKVTPMNTLQQVYIDRMGSMDWTDMLKDVIEGVFAYKPSWLCFDATGIGQPAYSFFIQEIIRRDPDWKQWTKKNLEDVIYTQSLKTEMVSDVDRLLCQNRFTKEQIIERFGDVMNEEANEMIYQNGLTLSTLEETKNQMHSFKAKRTESGKLKFLSEGGVNNDICNAIMLGVRAHKMLRGKLWTPDGKKRQVISANGKGMSNVSGNRLPTSYSVLPKRPEFSKYL